MDQILFYRRRSSVRKLLQEKINPERWSFFSKWSFFSEAKEWKKVMKDLTHESEEWRHLVTTGAVEACKIFKIGCAGGFLLALYLYFGKGGGGGGGGGDVVVNDEDVVVNDEDVNDDNVDDGNVAGGGGFGGGSQVSGSLIRHWEYLEAKKRNLSAGLPSIYVRDCSHLQVPRKKMVGGHLDIAIFKLMSTKIELTKLNQVANLFEWLIRLKTPPHVLVSNLCRVGTVSREKVLFNPMSSPFNAYNPMKHGPPNQLENNVLAPVSVALDAILARKGERKPDLFAVMAYHCLLRRS